MIPFVRLANSAFHEPPCVKGSRRGNERSDRGGSEGICVAKSALLASETCFDVESAGDAVMTWGFPVVILP